MMASKSFKGERRARQRLYDTCDIGAEDHSVLIQVREPEYRASAAMSVTPDVARKIAAELIKRAVEIEAAQKATA